MARKKNYNVYSVDVCVEPYCMEYILVGGESEQDIVDHLSEIFPDYVYDYDGEALDEEYDCKVIDGKVHQSYLTKNQIATITNKENWKDRFQKIPHLTTDKPYYKLKGYYYIE